MMKILHAPSNVCNIGWVMAEGLRARGHHVEVWNHGESPNDFSVDRVFDVGSDAVDYVDSFRAALDADFDVFHFHGTRTLIPPRDGLPLMWDLPILKALNKTVVFTFHGSDVRLKSLDRLDPWSFHNFSDIKCDEEKIGLYLSVISDFADHLTVGNILNTAYVPGSKYISKPLNLTDYVETGLQHTEPPRVLHITRRRATKGTDAILAAIAKLQAEGLRFDFKLLEGVSHKDAKQAINEADIIIEKVLSGDAGITALEAMASGKVVMSRIRDEVYQQHPDMPVVNANPETVQTELRNLIENASLRQDIARRGRPYVEANHSMQGVAEELEALYQSPRRKKRRWDVWDKLWP